MKGGAYLYIWGISLDYVPHLKGNELAWHRTNRSSMFDLRFDPVDHFKRYNDWYMRSFSEAEDFRRQASAQLRKAWPMAVQFFERSQRVEQLPELFADQMSASTFRFWFKNYVQHLPICSRSRKSGRKIALFVC
ncbi:hypothetical protein [Lysobacter sp. Root916]|uniref:hypothetical protein n=1 Tax=Lysobacter sp. Root916 TaxID=1736606 RepID=UPI0012FBA161|nr:hypothetical protein [Lysobacter sp. Root916]